MSEMKTSSGCETAADAHWYSVGSTALNWSILSISMVCLLIVISSSESTEPLYSYFHYTAPWHDDASSLDAPVMDKHELKRLKSGKEFGKSQVSAGYQGHIASNLSRVFPCQSKSLSQFFIQDIVVIHSQIHNLSPIFPHTFSERC